MATFIVHKTGKTIFENYNIVQLYLELENINNNIWYIGIKDCIFLTSNDLHLLSVALQNYCNMSTTLTLYLDPEFLIGKQDQIRLIDIVFTSNKNLQILKIHGIPEYFDPIKIPWHFVTTNLTTLSLDHCNITYNSLIVLNFKPCKITNLLLNNNHMIDDNCCNVLTQILTNPENTLETLSLENSKIHDIGFLILLKSFTNSNNKLINLHLDDTRINNSIYEKFVDQCLINKTLFPSVRFKNLTVDRTFIALHNRVKFETIFHNSQIINNILTLSSPNIIPRLGNNTPIKLLPKTHDLLRLLYDFLI